MLTLTVSPVNRSLFSLSNRQMEPGECPGVWMTSSVRPPRSNTSPSAKGKYSGCGSSCRGTIDFPLVVRVAHRRPRFHKPFAHRIVQRETAAVFPIQRVEIHMREMARAAHMVRVSVCRNNNEGKPCKPFDVFRQRADTSARVDQRGPVFSDHEKHINEFVFTDQISIRSYF